MIAALAPAVRGEASSAIGRNKEYHDPLQGSGATMFLTCRQCRPLSPFKPPLKRHKGIETPLEAPRDTEADHTTVSL